MSPFALIRKPSLFSRRMGSLVLVALLALLSVGVIAPFIDASRYGDRIRQTLQATLGRRIDFEAVHFTLFAGPGFTLEGVTIAEDPRYGIECFAYVPELQVRVRPDKLVFGLIQISSLRLVQPSLNLVKRDDGTWNAVELVQRLSAPRHTPLNFLPVFEVFQGRIDFKFGARKTTLYLLDSDLQIFPEHANKLSIRFSGSPARTDRAGNGFGHLHGTITWFLNRQSATDNQLEANLILDPSNLSEMATLVDGHDVGVHGTIASNALVSGPLSSLTVQGKMQLSDLHRWDLLPASGGEWQVPYNGTIDLVANRLFLKTEDQNGGLTPAKLQLVVSDFMTSPQLSLAALFERVPIAEVLPLGRRMGLPIPANISLQGDLGGEVRFTNRDGLSGNLVLENISAAIPQQEPLLAEKIQASLQDDRLVFQPSRIQTSDGVLQIGGEFWLATARSTASVLVDHYAFAALKRRLRAWLAAPSFLDAWSDGDITGALSYKTSANADPVWTGKFDFADATLRLPGLSSPLLSAEGRVSLNETTLDVSRFSAQMSGETVQAAYRYNASARRTERLRVEVARSELGELENFLAPTIQGQGWLAKLGVTTRSVPAWLAERDMDAELTIKQFRVGATDMGSLAAQLTWQGTNLRFSSLQIKLPAGSLHASGTANLSSYRPKCSFTASLIRYPWRGGLLNATGELQTVGVNAEGLQNLQATGNFNASNLRLNVDESLPAIAGNFDFSYRQGWPDLRLHDVQALDRDGNWSGSGAAKNDGSLILDLERGAQQRRIVSSLTDGPDAPALLADH